MAISVVMPALELTQESGKLVSWNKKEGDAVVKGETLLEVETDKAVVEVEALADGFLAGVTAQAGDVVPVGQTIAWIVAKGEAPPENESKSTSTAGASGKLAVFPEVRNVSSDSPLSSSKARMSPKARRIAGELNVNLDNVHGTGSAGEILASDIEAAAKSRTSTSVVGSLAHEQPETLSVIGRLMAERTTQSWTTVPHFFLVREVDASALLAARQNAASTPLSVAQIKITHTDLLIAIVSRILLKHRHMNASYTPQGIRFYAQVNMAIAIAVDDGVVAAVIPDAHSASIAEIASLRRDLAERAKARRSLPQDLTGATFTISNLGMYHIDSFMAIIPPQQAGILAVGAITDRVIAIDGKPAVRSMMTITLSCDHRVVSGARGAQFLDDLVNALAEPQKYLG